MLSIIDAYNSISFIGMSKNAGKTTALNYFIDLARGNFTLGLSSIGRDGETIDRVTSTSKPRIYIYRGTIISTASACLRLSDATLEILEVTDINTPMGFIVIARAVTDGYIELAGPSTNYQTKFVMQRMFGYGAEKVYIDGALSRKSFASPTVAEATIMSTGAAISNNFSKIIEETLHSYNMLTVKKYENEKIRERISQISESVYIISDDEVIFKSESTIIGYEKEIVDKITEDTKIIYTKGAITDVLADLLLRNLKPDIKPDIIIDDGTKIFIKKENIARLKLKGINIYSLNEINVVAITVNPFSADDYSIDSKTMIQALKKYIDIPVFDVMGKGNSYEISK